MKFLSALAVLFLLLSEECRSQSLPDSQEALFAILHDAQQFGYIGSANWIARPLHVLVEASDEEITRFADEPLAEHQFSLTLGLTTAVGRALEYGETDSSGCGLTASSREWEYFDRVLYKRYPAFIRWLPFVPEYYEPRRRSMHVEQYYVALVEWAATMDELAELERTNGPSHTIDMTRKRALAQEQVLEGKLSGKVLRLLAQRSVAQSSHCAALGWEYARVVFEANEGADSARAGAAAPIIFESIRRTPWRSLRLNAGGEMFELTYQIRPITRRWLNESLLYFLGYEWSSSSPYAYDWADAQGCDSPYRHNCVAQRAVIVRSSTDEREVVIGFLGERLPKHPSGIGRQNAEEIYVGGSEYTVYGALDRLRNGSF